MYIIYPQNSSAALVRVDDRVHNRRTYVREVYKIIYSARDGLRHYIL